jgi:hypothetical protein
LRDRKGGGEVGIRRGGGGGGDECKVSRDRVRPPAPAGHDGGAQKVGCPVCWGAILYAPGGGGQVQLLVCSPWGGCVLRRERGLTQHYDCAQQVGLVMDDARESGPNDICRV